MKNFSYILKNPDCREYDFTFYKQAGIPEYDIEININGETFQYPNRQEDFYFEQRN